MPRLTSTLLLLCAAIAAPASAQMGVYEEPAQSLDQAERNRQGIRISGTARQRAVPARYTVRRGDTLWDVTGRFYGNPWEWPRVWSYNPEITNPHWIYPLDQIRLLPSGAQVTTPNGSIAPVRTLESGTVFLQQEGYLDDDALEQAGVVIGSPEDHMLLAPYDQIYIEFDEEPDREPRGEYSVFREIGPEHRNPEEEGTLVRIYGTVQIESYDPERLTARATITDAIDPIERGFRVAPIPRRFDLVPPRPADRDLETTVSATLRPRQLIGDQQVVFLSVGLEDGVAVGNRFFVVHSGDVWREQLNSSAMNHGATVEAPNSENAFPSEIQAEARVVHVRPNSATLLLTRSIREVQVGDRVYMRRGY